MNQKGHFIQRKGIQLERNEVPVEKGEPLALEIASFLDCVLEAKIPKTDGLFGKSALEVALAVTKKSNQFGKPNSWKTNCLLHSKLRQSIFWL